MRCTSKIANGTNPPQIFSNETWPHAPTMNLLACHDDMVKMGVHHAKVMLHRLIIVISLLKITCCTLFFPWSKSNSAHAMSVFFCQLGTMTWYRKQVTNGTSQEIQLKHLHVQTYTHPWIHTVFGQIFLRRQSCMRHGGTHVQKSKRLGHKNWPGKNIEKKCVKNGATGLPVRTRSSCNVFIIFITIKHP